jgi:hypothetical protein
LACREQTAELSSAMTKAPVDVRRATLDDVDVLAPLFDGYRQFYRQAPDLERARQFLRERLLKHESTLFLARGAGAVPLGFTQLFPSFSSVSMARSFVLNDLFVAPEARRMGVARIPGVHSEAVTLRSRSVRSVRAAPRGDARLRRVEGSAPVLCLPGGLSRIHSPGARSRRSGRPLTRRAPLARYSGKKPCQRVWRRWWRRYLLESPG